MPTIHALISDLDDTLLDTEHQLSERTRHTLQRLLRQGVKVILASGRSASAMRPTVAQVGTPFPFIAFNGAQIIDPATGEVLVGNEIPAGQARDVLRWFEARDVYVQAYVGDLFVYAQEGPLADEYGRATGTPGMCVGTVSQYLCAPTPKLLGIDTPERIAALLDESRAHFGDALSITTSKPYFIEITSPSAIKGQAVRALAEKIGLSPETTLVAGDSLNDLSMLQWSRMPIAVSNARPEVQAVAWRVAGDGHADGLAALLDELIPEV